MLRLTAVLLAAMVLLRLLWACFHLQSTFMRSKAKRSQSRMHACAAYMRAADLLQPVAGGGALKRGRDWLGGRTFRALAAWGSGQCTRVAHCCSATIAPHPAPRTPLIAHLNPENASVVLSAPGTSSKRAEQAASAGENCQHNTAKRATSAAPNHLERIMEALCVNWAGNGVPLRRLRAH